MNRHGIHGLSWNTKLLACLSHRFQGPERCPRHNIKPVSKDQSTRRGKELEKMHGLRFDFIRGSLVKRHRVEVALQNNLPGQEAHLLRLVGRAKPMQHRNMKVVQKGQRLSIQPVTEAQWQEVCRMGGVEPR